MKYFIILFLLFPFYSFSQAIPNASFESWHVPGNYENPVSWDTPNDITSAISVFPVLKESNMVKDGTFSAHLETKQVFASVVPGLVCLGDFSVNIITSQITLGPGPVFTYRPSHFRGWYIYDPQGGDECYIAALLLKKNGSIYDTIGRAEFQTTAQNLNWQEFNIPFQYNSTDAPTHVNVICLSSYFFTTPQVNSALYIDGLSFEYNSSVGELYQSRSWIDPVTGIVEVPEEFIAGGSIILYDCAGKQLARCVIAGKQTFFSELISLKPGIYMAELTASDKHFSIKFKK